MATARKIQVHLPDPQTHPKQQAFVICTSKRKIIKAGRRGGKTVGAAIIAVLAFLAGHRVLYAAPTSEQVGKFWYEVTKAFESPIKAKVFYKNESEKYIDKRGTETRIKAKTAWNADTLRGDYADLLILDEWQLMNEEAWEVVIFESEEDGPVSTEGNKRVYFETVNRDPREAVKRVITAMNRPKRIRTKKEAAE